VSASDDFTTYNADQARVKFARAQYDALSVDEWVALVNQLDAVIEQQELQIAADSEDADRYRDLCD
jgi:hypothetical protein